MPAVNKLYGQHGVWQDDPATFHMTANNWKLVLLLKSGFPMINRNVRWQIFDPFICAIVNDRVEVSKQAEKEFKKKGKNIKKALVDDQSCITRRILEKKKKFVFCMENCKSNSWKK